MESLDFEVKNVLGATFGIIGLISGGALGGIIGAARGYFSEGYACHRVHECVQKLFKGVKQVAMAVGCFAKSAGSYAKDKFVAIRKAVRSCVSNAADSKGN